MRLIAFALLAVSAIPAGSGRLTAQEAPVVEVERLAEGRWRATYRLAGAVHALHFARSAGFYRERVWTPTTPGYRFGRDGDRQVVLLDQGVAPSREIVFEFPEFTDPLPKEYELFLPFQDGAVALYTGHFNAIVLTDDAAIAVEFISQCVTSAQ